MTQSQHAPSTPRFVHAPTVSWVTHADGPLTRFVFVDPAVWPLPQNDTLEYSLRLPKPTLALQETTSPLEALRPERLRDLLLAHIEAGGADSQRQLREVELGHLITRDVPEMYPRCTRDLPR